MKAFDSSPDRLRQQRRDHILDLARRSNGQIEDRQVEGRQQQARAEILRKLSEELQELRQAVAVRQTAAVPAQVAPPAPSYSAATISPPVLSIGEPFEDEPAPPPVSGLESRLSKLEASVAQLAETVNQRTEPTARLNSLESKLDILRTDLRTLEAGQSRIHEQIKGFDQLFASLTRDSQKLNAVVEGLAAELRHDPASEASASQSALEGRLSATEAGLREIGGLRQQFQEMEVGLERVLRAVEALQAPVVPTESAAEREATANVLASLTKLVQGMRAAQQDREKDSVASRQT